MAETYKSKRVKFPVGKQRLFLEKTEKTLTVKEMARLCNKSERTIRDWRREKFLMDAESFKILCDKLEISQPNDIEEVDEYWYAKKGANLGWEAVAKKHGRIPGDEVYRKERWREWWEKEGQYNKEWSKNNTSLKVKRPSESKELAEFIGIVLGDGGLSKYQLKITLHSEDDKDYGKHVRTLVSELFDVPVVRKKRKHANACDYVVSRTELVKYCTELGLKVGNKTKHQVDVPEWIKNNREYMIACLKGLMDTDGCVFTHKYKSNGKYYSYKKLSFTNTSKPLSGFVHDSLVVLGINVRNANNKKHVRIDGISDMEKYFEIVGSNNTKHLKRYKI